VGGSGNVFVAQSLAGTVTKYSQTGRLLARWSGFQDPGGIAVDGRGDIFVAEHNARTVTKLSPGGSVLAQLAPDKLYPPGGPGSPTGVAIQPPDSLYIATTCVIGTTCGVGTDVAPHGESIDGLYEILSQGPRQGYLKEIWFGLGYLPDGSPQQPPYKEAEPFAGIDAITSDRKGNLYVAGLLWPLGGKPRRGVLAYTPFGYKWARWDLPSQTSVRGIAVDPQGTVYVSQAHRVLKLVK
jgi:streptogramin lyase